MFTQFALLCSTGYYFEDISDSCMFSFRVWNISEILKWILNKNTKDFLLLFRFGFWLFTLSVICFGTYTKVLAKFGFKVIQPSSFVTFRGENAIRHCYH